ncbi:cytochrome P450 76T24-like [Salvia hispanica]|uniref:cytochrome P450 76T24-like n=1 Tax=Salvia hispanica TaxID=49212 RepID=UPI0020099583|nr:cytochrome P450 76T24-like [Salvia hispanica]
MDSVTSSIILASIAWICILISRAWKSSKLPPGPYGLPIIGNILQLGPKPHHSLAKLSRKYGPVMSLKLGSITTVVFSSPETAKLVLQKHDSSFSSRTIPSANKVLRHHEFSVGWLPVGTQWAKLRKICREQMFSAPRLDASEGLRREKLQKLQDYLAERCERGTAVDVGEAAFTTALNLMSASLFSAEFVQFGSEKSQEMKEVMSGLIKCVGRPNLADFFPVLKALDPQGIYKETKFYFEKLFAKLDEIIDEKLKSGGQKRDLVEALLEIHRSDEAQLTRRDIRHLLLSFS